MQVPLAYARGSRTAPHKTQSGPMVAHVSLEGSPDLCSDNPAQMRVRTHIPHNRRLANRTREDHLVDRSADHWVDRSADH